jgi:hypothetical protein
MNHESFSPGQSNEAVDKKVTPSSRGSDAFMEGSSSDDTSGSMKKRSISSRLLLGEDLQKIRHSSHRHVLQGEEGLGVDDMEESNHDNVITDLLYPALEGSSSQGVDFDFFEDDYKAAQAAMNSSIASAAASAVEPSSSLRSSPTNFDDSLRNASISSSMSLPQAPRDPSYSSTAHEELLNALRRRSSITNETFDATTDKHRR